MDTMKWMAIASLAIICACGGSDPVPSGIDGGTRADTGIIAMMDAGPSGCTVDTQCDDGVDCTTDTCVTASGNCRHVITPALCAAGESCDPVMGCQMGMICGTSADCEDMNPCTTAESCDIASHVCTFLPLDSDFDRDVPRVCGGGDCDDSDPEINSGAMENCNTVDDDCDGSVDEDFDLMNDSRMCGSCRNECALAQHCAMGRCTCDDPMLTNCRGTCVNTNADRTHCGDCDTVCPESDMICNAGSCECTGGRTWCVGYCLDLSILEEHCGRCGNACPATQTCTGGVCGCTADQTNCGGTCTDTSLDPAHCGGCGRACPAGDACIGGVCGGCGGAGERCCYEDMCSTGCEYDGFDGIRMPCISGTCRACGNPGQPCCIWPALCSQSSCHGSSTCNSATSLCM